MKETCARGGIVLIAVLASLFGAARASAVCDTPRCFDVAVPVPAGLSMGGFGAMSYAARHRGLFRAAASFSGAVDTRYVEPASGIGFNIFHDTFGTPDDRVWGNQVTDEATWRAHNPTDRAADL